MTKYIKKPVAIEAIEWTGDNLDEIVAFTDGGAWTYLGLTSLILTTLEGDMFATSGDMIIKGVKGECYPCKPDIFKLTYYTESEYAESNL